MRVLGQSSNDDPDLFYSQIFMYSLRQLYSLISSIKSSKLSMKSMYLHFPISDLAVKWSRSTQGHHLNNLSSTWMPNVHTKFQGHWSIGFGRFLKVFTIYGHGDHLGHVTQLICMIFHFHLPHKLSYEIKFQMTKRFPRKTSFNFKL